MVRIAIIDMYSPHLLLGDNVRKRKIRETLQKSGIKTLDIRLTPITRSTITNFGTFKELFSNFFPPHKANSLKLSFETLSIVEQAEFIVSLNSLVRAIRYIKPDVLLAEGSKVGWITTLVAKKFSLPSIIDVHGLSFAEARGWGNNRWRHIFDLEKESFENCDHLIVVSEKMKLYVLNEMGIPSNKIVIASNGGDPQVSVAKYEKPLKVVYAGIFSYWEKLNDFLEIAKYSNEHNFKFFLAGAGPKKDELIRRIRDEKIPVNYLGYIPTDKIHYLLSKMQIGIAPSTKDLARQVASPIKIFDYMASGLPVITPKIGDWGSLIEREDCGVAVDVDSIHAYLNSLEELSNETLWQAKSKNAIRAIQKNYNWTKVLEPVTSLVSEYK